MAEKIKFYFDEGKKKFELKMSTKGSSGIDLRSQVAARLGPFERRLIPTGLHVDIPRGFEIQIRPRSGMALKNGITVLNSPGTIDSDYRGEIGVILYNSSEIPFYIMEGDRIAQMVVAKVFTKESFFEEVETFESLNSSERGDGGFGSTGKK
jgi:dUTP pyrophosphatase